VTGSHIEWNQDGLDRIAELQRQLTAKVQEAAIAVNNEMAGQPVEDIMTALRSRIRKLKIEPNEEGILKIAEAISERKFAE
jgi:hypothetical protein